MRVDTDDPATGSAGKNLALGDPIAHRFLGDIESIRNLRDCKEVIHGGDLLL